MPGKPKKIPVLCKFGFHKKSSALTAWPKGILIFMIPKTISFHAVVVSDLIFLVLFRRLSVNDIKFIMSKIVNQNEPNKPIYHGPWPCCALNLP